MLLVFGKEDGVSEAWFQACKKQGHDTTIVKTSEDALKAVLGQPGHDLVVIDSRTCKHFIPQNICRSIRASDSSAYTVIVAIVKKK